MPNRSEGTPGAGPRRRVTKRAGRDTYRYQKPAPGTGSYQSSIGDVLANAFDVGNKLTVEAANEAFARTHQQKRAPQTTIKAKPKARPAVAQGDPEMAQSNVGGDILDVMKSMLTDSQSATFDYESALQQSEAAIRGAYAAEINAIRSNNRAARRDTSKARREVEHMYNGLAATYGRDANVANAQGTKDAADITGIANEANQNITNAQMETSKQQMEMLKGLGIEEIAPELLSGDNKALNAATQKVTEHGARHATTAKENASANSAYFQRGAAGAKFEGAGRSSDLLSQLQDYIRGNRNEIAGIKGKRGQDIAQNRIESQKAAADAQSKADSELWSRMQDFAGLQKDIEDTNFDNNLSANKFKYQQKNDAADRSATQQWRQAQLDAKARSNSSSGIPKNLRNAMEIIHTNGQQKQKLASVLEALTGTDPWKDGSISKDMGKGKVKTTKLTPYAAKALAEIAGKKAGLSQNDINILKLAAYASVE